MDDNFIGNKNPQQPLKRPAPRWHKLPNGLSIQYQNSNEALYVYKEVFEDQVYLRHGITIEEGDCVFDVGANIGLFALYVQKLRNGVTVHAFEPSPEVREILTANVAPFSSRVKIHPCGLSDAEKEAVFTFYPKCTILSGFHANASGERDILRAAIRNQFSQKFTGKDGLEDRHLDSLVEEMLAGKREFICPLRTISAIIEEENIDAIDLLKIDVEKSELDVLYGIRDHDWGLIRQIVIEVHDMEGDTLQRIQLLLKENGFCVTCEEEWQLKDSRIINLYSRRV